MLDSSKRKMRETVSADWHSANSRESVDEMKNLLAKLFGFINWKKESAPVTEAPAFNAGDSDPAKMQRQERISIVPDQSAMLSVGIMTVLESLDHTQFQWTFSDAPAYNELLGRQYQFDLHADCQRVGTFYQTSEATAVIRCNASRAGSKAAKDAGHDLFNNVWKHGKSNFDMEIHIKVADWSTVLPELSKMITLRSWGKTFKSGITQKVGAGSDFDPNGTQTESGNHILFVYPTMK